MWYNGIAKNHIKPHKERLFYMNHYTKLAWRLKREIFNFSKKICTGLKRPEDKLISNLLYGIAESGSCHLSKIGRALKEPILLKKTIERLSRGLRDFTVEDRQKLIDNYNQSIRKSIDNRTVYVIDLSDVIKPYSEKLEGLALVRDGSTGDLEKGYWTLEIAALTSGTKTPLPVYDRVSRILPLNSPSSLLPEKWGNSNVKKDRFFKSDVIYFDIGMEAYRSGHNGPDSKSK